MNPPATGDGTSIRNAMRLVGLVGLLVSGSIVTGTWVGIKLDRVFQTNGLLGVVAGLGLAGWALFHAARYQEPD